MLLLPMYAEVITADIRQMFSDIYKDDNGFRPDLSRWDRVSMEAYLDNRPEVQYDETDEFADRCCDASSDCWCCHYDWCHNSDYYDDWDRLLDGLDNDITIEYSEYAEGVQDGWA